MRLKCRKCNKTHSIKPHFLASGHQYDTFKREAYVRAYNESTKYSLRKLLGIMFPNLLVSHTVMYYWVRIIMVKKNMLEPELVKEIQDTIPEADITEKYLEQASEIPKNTRNKPYSHDMVKLFNWGRIYLQISDINAENFSKNPYIFINRIMDILRPKVFL
jgi:hypothetical protein